MNKHFIAVTLMTVPDENGGQEESQHFALICNVQSGQDIIDRFGGGNLETSHLGIYYPHSNTSLELLGIEEVPSVLDGLCKLLDPENGRASFDVVDMYDRTVINRSNDPRWDLTTGEHGRHWMLGDYQ